MGWGVGGGGHADRQLPDEIRVQTRTDGGVRRVPAQECARRSWVCGHAYPFFLFFFSLSHGRKHGHNYGLLAVRDLSPDDHFVRVDRTFPHGADVSNRSTRSLLVCSKKKKRKKERKRQKVLFYSLLPS